MGRSTLIAEPIGGVDGHSLLVATSHFESRNNTKIRKEQMELTFQRLEGKDFILMGDFNFDAGWIEEENVILKAGCRDIMHDYVDRNDFTMFKTPMFQSWRPDKIVTHQDCKWRAVDAHIAGRYSIYQDKSENIRRDGKVRTPSDHMCVIADFKYDVDYKPLSV